MRKTQFFQQSKMCNRPETTLVSINECNRFIKDCLMAVGASEEHAQAQSDLLSNADYVGHYSHGMNRLEMYIEEIQSGLCDPVIDPIIIKETAATAWVDGQNGLGAVIGNFCMDLAIEKAKNVGIGWVVAKNSNHYGVAQHYTLRASKKGLLGFTCTNTSPLMTPTRSKVVGLGTNPLSLCAPGQNGDRFLLDMATTAVALGKLEMKRRKGEPLPVGWATDAEGRITTDVNIACASRSLMPLGGGEDSSGFKGYGLALMVDILSGVLAGANSATNIRRWGEVGKQANLGQCFYAIDPNCFAPGFEERLSNVLNSIRKLPPVDEEKPVLVAGDPELNHMREVDKCGGVKFVRNQMETCAKLAKMLNVDGLKPLRKCPTN